MMKVTPPNTNTPVVSSTDGDNKTEVVTQAAQQTTDRKTNSHSTQMQLLSLARTFALDGGMLEQKKQMPLEDRASKRARINRLRKQQNLEAIVHKAIPYCSTEEAAERADPDWFSQFTKLAEDVSSSAMQDLWAKILAGELSQPGAFSIKTLQAFKTMSIHEAKLLAKACRLSVRDGRGKNIRIISGCYQVPGLFNFFDKQREQTINLSQRGLSYSDILTLADNHLMYEQETESSPMAKGEAVNFNYNGQNLALVTTKSDCILRFYKFTPTGVELARLISDNPDTDYISLLKSQLQHHFSITA